MPSKTERTALTFLAGVVLAGGLVRVVRAIARAEPPPPAAAAALARQREIVDSVARARALARAARGDRAGNTGKQGASARGTPARPVPDQVTPPVPPAPVAASPYPMNVNRASAVELEGLPRIGPAIAQRIVDERTANGPYSGLAALDSRVKGIGPAIVRAIAPLVTFSPP